jgi:signal transduction histidine kinase/ActR/RegA family two-component response regulator
MKVTPVAVAVPLLLLLLTWLLLRGMNPDAQPSDQALRNLDDFATAQSTLHRDILTARAGLLRNYDPLVREVDALRDTLGRLRQTVAPDPEQRAAIERLADAVSRQETLTEQFKSDNALLQNSLTYFSLFSARLGAGDLDGPVGSAVSALAAAMLHLTLDTSPAAAQDVQERLDQLARQQIQPADAPAVQALLAHGRLLHDLLPATDTIVKALFDLASKRELTTLRALTMAQQQADEQTAQRFRLLLYAASLLLLGLLVHLGLQLRDRARALQRRATVEHMIAGISTRFINAQPHEIGPHIEQALAQLAAGIGADRAYFLTSGLPPQLYAWSREGTLFPPGWPYQALALSTRFHPTAEGIIHVPKLDLLPPGMEHDVLTAAGLHGWACVARLAGDGNGSILGFDVLHAGFLAKPGELGLLRMALDALANAVGRHRLERERARLETRLQQARRMETVGALASGIAHNFNNIVGAILGYAEIAEAKLAADNEPAGYLDEIRRAGERARDLVDQILAFGRRRDTQRRPVKITALMAEAASLLQASLPPEIDLAVTPVPAEAIVSGEPAQLQQVIVNLCNNAAQAMDGAGRVEVEATLQDITRPRQLSHGALVQGHYVCLAVSDTGRGMDEAVLGRLFEPFFTTRAAGNGLGLATVREIVQEHGGAMHVRSTLGQGSRFEAWLPCTGVTEGVAGGEPTPLPLGQGETLLIIDEESERLLRDEDMLAALGYEPVGFAKVDQALAACRTAPTRFDAVVVGQVTSTQAALDLAAALHQIAPDLPILLATAGAQDIEVDALVHAGIAELVRRPLVSTEIATVLKRSLAAKPAAPPITAVTLFPAPEITG